MKPKILIIDDEIHIVELIRFNLETSGYEVDIAYDGLDGFENIKITENTITATLKTKQTGPNENDEWVKQNDKTSEFKLVKQGEQWLVDEFNSSDLD